MLDTINPQTPRQHWMAVLARAPRADLEAKIATLKNPPDYALVREPEIGLIMARGRVNTSKEAFNVGEVSVTRASVRLKEGILGVCYCLGRDQKKAVMAAYVDALLQMPHWHAHVMSAIVAPLSTAEQEERDAFTAEVAATKVDFFTLVRGEDAVQEE